MMLQLPFSRLKPPSSTHILSGKSALCSWRDGGYSDVLLGIHPGNTSPTAQPKELPVDTAGIHAHLQQSSSPNYWVSDFLLNIPSMALSALPTFLKVIAQELISPLTSESFRERNVKELAERSQRLCDFPDPVPAK